jgi:CubicO group peptidase (beta-lactamase class C family)
MMANWSPSHYTQCLVQVSSHATAIDARAIDDTVAAVDEAIGNGGRTVAVVEIGVLLRKGGVLDRLKAEGLSIAGP